MTTEPDIHELLSAYVDDEVDAAERAIVEDALAASAALRAELAELESTKGWVRGLPEVAPATPLVRPNAPAAVADRADAPARQRRVGRLGLTVAAVAAVWLVILSVGVGVGRLPIVPDIDQLSAQHASAEPMSGFVEMADDDMDSMKDDPAVLSDIGYGMVRDGVFVAGEIVHVRYSDGLHDVSVFHQAGTVDWDNMPSMGEVEKTGSEKIWRGELDGRSVLVTERGDLVVTVVADDGMEGDMAMHASSMVPEVEIDESFMSKLRDAPANLVDRVN